ncbi:MAG: DUF4469 domain-containing protein [Tannerellaceae bacterium]|jgi:hypothetical protein|nr:DUF4469 domain-containing protein [Tannerellaceae bacterium]
MAKKFFWKIWLTPNNLTKEVDNDYIAEVSTVQYTMRNEDIARMIVNTRSELRYETILGILNERDAVVLDSILAGSSVQDGNIHISPRILGNWIGADPAFDPKEHTITVTATPTNTLRNALHNDVGVQLLGKKTDGGAIIGLVTDIITGSTSGQITSKGNIIIEGEKIKIAPIEVPNQGDTPLGVFFVDKDGTSIPLDQPLTVNDPKKIICTVPAQVSNGRYTLKIVTRFTTSSNTLLHDPRTIVYELLLQEGVVPD